MDEVASSSGHDDDMDTVDSSREESRPPAPSTTTTTTATTTPAAVGANPSVLHTILLDKSLQAVLRVFCSVYGRDTEGNVPKEQYLRVYTALVKVLHPAVTFKEAEASAEQDWLEDLDSDDPKERGLPISTLFRSLVEIALQHTKTPSTAAVIDFFQDLFKRLTGRSLAKLLPYSIRLSSALQASTSAGKTGIGAEKASALHGGRGKNHASSGSLSDVFIRLTTLVDENEREILRSGADAGADTVSKLSAPSALVPIAGSDGYAYVTVAEYQREMREKRVLRARSGLGGMPRKKIGTMPVLIPAGAAAKAAARTLAEEEQRQKMHVVVKPAMICSAVEEATIPPSYVRFDAAVVNVMDRKMMSTGHLACVEAIRDGEDIPSAVKLYKPWTKSWDEADPALDGLDRQGFRRFKKLLPDDKAENSIEERRRAILEREKERKVAKKEAARRQRLEEHALGLDENDYDDEEEGEQKGVRSDAAEGEGEEEEEEKVEGMTARGCKEGAGGDADADAVEVAGESRGHELSPSPSKLGRQQRQQLSTSFLQRGDRRKVQVDTVDGSGTSPQFRQAQDTTTAHPQQQQQQQQHHQQHQSQQQQHSQRPPVEYAAQYANLQRVVAEQEARSHSRNGFRPSSATRTGLFASGFKQRPSSSSSFPSATGGLTPEMMTASQIRQFQQAQLTGSIPQPLPMSMHIPLALGAGAVQEALVTQGVRHKGLAKEMYNVPLGALPHSVSALSTVFCPVARSAVQVATNDTRHNQSKNKNENENNSKNTAFVGVAAPAPMKGQKQRQERKKGTRSVDAARVAFHQAQMSFCADASALLYHETTAASASRTAGGDVSLPLSVDASAQQAPHVHPVTLPCLADGGSSPRMGRLAGLGPAGWNVRSSMTAMASGMYNTSEC